MNKIPDDIWREILDYLKGTCSKCGISCKTCQKNEKQKCIDEVRRLRSEEISICTVCKSGPSCLEPCDYTGFDLDSYRITCNICSNKFLQGFNCISYEINIKENEENPELDGYIWHDPDYGYDYLDSKFSECDFDICQECYDR
jgi:hypothetical protein